MRLLYNIQLHQKALAILEMIERCTIYENTNKHYLNEWDGANWMDLIRIAYEREELDTAVNKYAAIKQRLIKSYTIVRHKINTTPIDYVESKKLVPENY